LFFIGCCGNGLIGRLLPPPLLPPAGPPRPRPGLSRRHRRLSEIDIRSLNLLALNRANIEAFSDLKERKMAKLSESDRKKLPASKFAEPDKKAYPIEDAAHAKNAKARASQAVKAGRMSKAEGSKIDKKADTVIKKD
jgi:hypothetical protein